MRITIHIVVHKHTYIYIELYRDTYDDVFEKMTIWLWNVFLVVPLPEVPARRGDLNRWWGKAVKLW